MLNFIKNLTEDDYNELQESISNFYTKNSWKYTSRERDAILDFILKLKSKYSCDRERSLKNKNE